MTYDEIRALHQSVESRMPVKQEVRILIAGDAPLHLRVSASTNDPVVISDNGLIFQRCGGGRRVIRKKIGS